MRRRGQGRHLILNALKAVGQRWLQTGRSGRIVHENALAVGRVHRSPEKSSSSKTIFFLWPTCPRNPLFQNPLQNSVLPFEKHDVAPSSCHHFIPLPSRNVFVVWRALVLGRIAGSRWGTASSEPRTPVMKMLQLPCWLLWCHQLRPCRRDGLTKP